jgi:hypothetical protein
VDRLIFVDKGVPALAVSDEARHNAPYCIWSLSERKPASQRDIRHVKRQRQLSVLTVDTVELGPLL